MIDTAGGRISIYSGQVVDALTFEASLDEGDW